MTGWVQFDRFQVPIPRLFAFVGESDTFTIGVEISNRYGDPFVDVGIEFPWRRPRPYHISGHFPSKFGPTPCRWRRP